MRRLMRCIAVLGAGTAMVACGGGGGSSSTAPTAVVTQPTQPTASVGVSTTAVDIAFLNQHYLYSISVTNSGATNVQTSVTGSLPPGIAFTSSNNTLSGTPTQVGVFNFTFTIKSADNAAVTASRQFTIQVLSGAGTVRNDTLASATPLACCMNIHASFSPYSKASGAAAADQDYYRITANAGDRISIDAIGLPSVIDTDTVLEIVDVNGTRMATCRTPQTNTGFNQPCLNDDINTGIVRNSHLEVQLPASSGVFVVHVLDWGGRARPEMFYDLRMFKLP